MTEDGPQFGLVLPHFGYRPDHRAERLLRAHLPPDARLGGGERADRAGGQVVAARRAVLAAEEAEAVAAQARKGILGEKVNSANDRRYPLRTISFMNSSGGVQVSSKNGWPISANSYQWDSWF